MSFYTRHHPEFTTVSGRAPINPDQYDTPHIVYRFLDTDGNHLYIGASINFKSRLSAHKSKPWWKDVATIRVRELPTKRRALDIERALTFKHQPKYNKGWALKYPDIKGLRDERLIAELKAAVKNTIQPHE